jgi:precorrin-3B synthase
MTALAPIQHRKRGACPGLSAPMTTGDGLLVRLQPIGTIPLAAFCELCAAARTYGNGIIEITSRGSVQVRGLITASAPHFANRVAALNIAADDGVPVLCNPLAGLAEEIFNTAAFGAELRRALAQRSMAERLGAKVSVAIDGGGALRLDAIAADIRICAEAIDGDVALCIAAGGDAANAAPLGSIARRDGIEAVIRLLDVIARRGRDARARDIPAQAFSSAIAEFMISARPRKVPSPQEAIGQHPLRDGSMACGIGLAFGHAGAASLERLIEAARAAGVIGLRAAPGRVLMAIGFPVSAAAGFATAADELGFITRADDPRGHVIACAGSPICASAHFASRAMAPRIAEIAAPYIDASHAIHLSGCAKGCAHAAPASLTVVGTAGGCALIANGSARDTPFAIIAADKLPGAIAAHMREARLENQNG